MSILALLNDKLPKIEKGCKNTKAVKALQEALHRLGYYDFLIDGKFGNQTDGAVRWFQNSVGGISVDGDVGPVTAAAIDKALSTAAPKLPLVDTDFPYRKEYEILWNTMVIRNSVYAALDKRINFLRQPERWAEYMKLAEATGVPPQVTAVINEREASGNLKGVLHNGELIVGTNRKTKLVPAGRGPFATFFDAGVDAYRKEGMIGLNWRSGPARCLYFLEKFNGFGYRKQGIKSPYVWAGSTHYVTGKYIRDGVFSRTHTDTQLGGAPLLKRMMDRDASLHWNWPK